MRLYAFGRGVLAFLVKEPTVKRWFTIGTVALCLVIASSSSRPAFAKDEPKWIEVHATHFSVLSDAGEKRGREVALRMEQMRAVFGQLLLKNKLKMPVPITVIALKSDQPYGLIAPAKQTPGQDRAPGQPGRRSSSSDGGAPHHGPGRRGGRQHLGRGAQRARPAAGRGRLTRRVQKPRAPAAAPLHKIELLVLDVDGVLTDGRLYYSRPGGDLEGFPRAGWPASSS